MQTTILNPISCYGIGVHSGRETQLTLKPALHDTGVVFVRTDITSVDNVVYPHYTNVHDTTLSTSVKNDASVSISTIEHLMAAIWGCGLDNVLIEIDGAEVPIMDGSSKPFVFMIECAGIKKLNYPKKYLKLLKDIHICNDGSEIVATRANELSIYLTIDFKSPAIGKQQHSFSQENTFKKDLADSRTFGFLDELDYLRNQGLAKGASLDNAIGIDKDVIMNHDGLRHDNEFVRHKMLDFVGDLFSCGGSFIGDIKGFKTSHMINNQLVHKIFDTPSAYQWVEKR